MTEDPKRLIDSPGESELVREHLRVAAGRSPVAYDANAGLEQLEATVGADGAGAAATSATGWSSPWLWILGAGLVVGLVLLARPEPPDPPPLPVVATQHDAAVDPKPPPAEAPPTATDAQPVGPRAEPLPPAQAPEPAKTAPRPSKQDRPEPSADPKDSEPGAADDTAFNREMKLMANARKALAKHPAKTRRLTRQAAKEFPEGFFAEEREALAVLALVGLGRTDQARAKAEAFLKRYPRGTFSEKVRRATQE